MADIVDDTETFTIDLTEVPAKGEIINLSYPKTVGHGETFDVDASTKNVGKGSGVFRMELYVNGTLSATSLQFKLSAGKSSSDLIPAKSAPTSGESMSIVVKCIRIT